MKFYKIIFYFFLLFIFSFNKSYSNITAIEEKFNNLILNNHTFEYPYLENRHDIGVFYDFTYNEELNKIIIKKLRSDGILVSTPAGSTAYNLSVHGPILNLNSKKIAITPISPFRPRRWKGITLSEKSKIKILNLDHVKRPISSVADNVEVRNAKKIKVKIDKKINFTLLYDKKKSLHKKIRIEQLKKETSTN